MYDRNYYGTPGVCVRMDMYSIHRFLFRLPHVMVLDGLRVGALRFAIDKTNQESNTVCVYVYLGNEQA